ncbi:MAG: MaoC/PaaZ C-terminal domain-containing protein [Dehalococcoidia bacterium]|nr:MaoC/PaaZ C-terminal domain-containing protein [Dehalococcoidia bacterium]MDZ4246860.1 MaoC/PaaZ C-terminal domain-containing protein [Dehalococcoidia bacterium]
MAQQLYYEDVEVGTELPVLVKNPTTQQLVKWAGASGDYYQIHYDEKFAISTGLTGVIVHGWLTASFLGQLVTDWIGDRSALRKFGCSYRGVLYPGEPVTCKGKVTKKYAEEGHNFIECEIWAENPKGEAVVPGQATVILPLKASG